MAITAGTYTIGSGKTYATINAFQADIGATLTGNLSGVVQTDITETSISTFSTALAGYTLRITSDVGPSGDFTAGRNVTMNLADYCIDVTATSASAGAKFIIDNLRFTRSNTPADNYPLINLATATTNITCVVRDNVVNLASKLGSFVWLREDATVADIYNNVIVSGSLTDSRGIYIVHCSSSSIIENNTIMGLKAGYYERDQHNPKVRNNACFQNTYDFAKNAPASIASGFFPGVPASGNASSDTSAGPSGFINVNAAGQFQSIVIADGATFGKLIASGCLLANNGVVTAIADNDFGIRGNARPHTI